MGDRPKTNGEERACLSFSGEKSMTNNRGRRGNDDGNRVSGIYALSAISNNNDRGNDNNRYNDSMMKRYNKRGGISRASYIAS